ncbi:hypothetical protein N9B03_08035 [Akkermansiaceae bacterium]|nr:hypothetical protein [Akkermansiaceae bacterium]
MLLSTLLHAQFQGERDKAARALKILDGWHKQDSREGRRTLHFVLWTPKGRPPPVRYEARLTRMMIHIQDFYKKEMERLGFGPRSINLPMEAGKLRVHLIDGRKPES